MNNLTGNTIENGCILLGPERRGNLIAENKINGGNDSNGEVKAYIFPVVDLILI